MARWTISSYNRFIGAAISNYKLSRKDAAQMYREMKASLNRPVFRTDIKHHPRIAKRSAERAFALKARPPERIVIKRGKREEEELEELLEELEEEGYEDEEVEVSEQYA